MLINTVVRGINSSFHSVVQHRHKLMPVVPGCGKRYWRPTWHLCTGKKKRKGEGERVRDRFCIAACVERVDLTGSEFYRFHNPNYIDFPLQSAPFLLPFPLVRAFISFLNFCSYSLLTVTLMSRHPLGEFSLFAWIRYCILGVICQFILAVGIGFSHWWSHRMCFLTRHCPYSL